MKLQPLVEQAATEPDRIAALLVPYARARRWEVVDLAQALECGVEAVPRILLSHRPVGVGQEPDSPGWWSHLAGITSLWGGRTARLAALLRAASAEQGSRVAA